MNVEIFSLLNTKHTQFSYVFLKHERLKSQKRAVHQRDSKMNNSGKVIFPMFSFPLSAVLQ